MDEKTRQILALLRQDARLPVKTIAGKVGLSRSAVQSRIARLEADGVIRGYRAQLSAAAGGSVAAFLLIRLSKTPAHETVDRIVRNPAVVRCNSVGGDIDVIAEIEAETMEALNAARDEIAVQPGVQDVTTVIILRREKDG